MSRINVSCVNELTPLQNFDPLKTGKSNITKSSTGVATEFDRAFLA